MFHSCLDPGEISKDEAVTSAVFAWIRTFVWYILVRLAIISLVELSILSAMMVMPIFGPIWMMGVWLAPIFPLY